MSHLTEEAAVIVELIHGKGAVLGTLALHSYIRTLKLAIENPDSECRAEELASLREYVTGLEAAESIFDSAISTGKEPHA